MKLNIDQIKQMTTGAVRIAEENGSIHFFRFTKEQEDLYQVTNQDLYEGTFATAGVKLLFQTNSDHLSLRIKTAPATTRKYFSLDVWVDGKPAGYIDNFSDTMLPKNYTQADLPLGEFSKEFQLGDGVKTVCIHMPWSVKTTIEEIVLDDDAWIKGIRPEKKLLALGDSITHGYDALRTANRYIAKLADTLGAEEYNKAIGGHMFFPELATLKEPFMPDYITVAYGTNDWNFTSGETFHAKCRAFFENLNNLYPGVKIFVITPIWRSDTDKYQSFCDFGDLGAHIEDIVKNFENMTVIPGMDLVPNEERYFADFIVHPNDDGFSYYAENICRKIKAHI